MPSVRDKACQLSTHRRNTFFKSSKLSKNTKRFTEWIHTPLCIDNLLKNRLGYRRTDMPQAGEEQVFKKSKKSPPGSAKHHPTQDFLKKPSTGIKRIDQCCRDAEESAANPAGSLAPKKDSGVNLVPVESSLKIADNCAKILNLPLPGCKERQVTERAQTIVKPTTSTAAYLDFRLDQELRRRKKQIVDLLMAAILECLDKNLEALEEACDGDRPSHTSSSGSGNGTQQTRLAGQKRQLQRDEQDEEECDDDENGGKDRNNKRTKMVKDDARLKFACPYYKYDPDRFQGVRTCCGPGWHEVHRVKEHLQRAHSLPKYQCNRCCQFFKEESKLKAHQRETTPCPIRDIQPASVERDLGDGFDQDQDKRLQKRLKGTSEEKWREYYCILFYLPPGSPEIPSPYYDTSDRVSGRSALDNNDNFRQYRDYFRRELPPLIRNRIEIQVENSMRQCGVADHIKSNVMESIRDLPAMLHHIFQSIPPPPGSSSEDDAADPTVPPNYDPDSIFNELSFDYLDGFDFGTIDDAGPVSLESSSSSSNSEDVFCAPASSATSVEDQDTEQPSTARLKRQPVQPTEQRGPGCSTVNSFDDV